MLKVGLTGNYCSGLDIIGNIFKKCKIPVFESDLIIKFMFYNNSETIKKIHKEFGKSVFSDNILDMNAFQEPAEFKKLIKIIELDIIKAFEKWKLQQTGNYCIFKSQILYELGWNSLMNLNITVFKPNGLRVEDIQIRNKVTVADAYGMMENEMDLFQKNRLSDYTIHNYPAYHDSLERQIAAIDKSITSKSFIHST
jgi:dephospho-CoA kinase